MKDIQGKKPHFRFEHRAATGVRDENLNGRALTAAENSRRNETASPV
jgi:hypothetical protein